MAQKADVVASAGSAKVFPPLDSSSRVAACWLAISFGPFYMLVRRLILPRAGKVFKERDIASDVADAIVVRFHW
jgi:hypothetical protein